MVKVLAYYGTKKDLSKEASIISRYISFNHLKFEKHVIIAIHCHDSEMEKAKNYLVDCLLLEVCSIYHNNNIVGKLCH